MKYNTTQDRHPTLRIEDMPIQDRPYEKCLSHGCASLSDRELLAIILRCGIILSCGALLHTSVLRHSGVFLQL